MKHLIQGHYKQMILAFYLSWYLYIVINYFDSNYLIWSNALLIAIVVGIALNLSANNSKKSNWVTLRFFLIPFAVSSYTALISGRGFVAIFPSSFMETAAGLLISCGFVLVYLLYLMKTNKS